MRNRWAVCLICIIVLTTLACNLSVKEPTVAPEGLALTVTALTRLLDVTPSPAAITALAPAAATTSTLVPLPTAPAQVRLVTGISAAYMETPPITDGQLTEWSQAWSVVASPVYGIENWRGVDDLSGVAVFGWDEDYFYLALRVTDDVYVQNATGAQIYKGDSLEILFDADLAGDFYDNELTSDDFQLGISPGTPTAGIGMEAYQWLPAHLEAARSEITIAARPTELGYDIEVVIPWSVLEITPQAWQHYGMAISLSDDDKIDTILQQSMVSNTPDRRLTRPTTWGDLVLTR